MTSAGPVQKEPVRDGPDEFGEREDFLSPVNYQAQAEAISEEATTAFNFPPDGPR